MRYWNPADPAGTFRFDLGQGPGQLLQVVYLLPIEVAVALQAFAAALLWGAAVVVATRGLPKWVFVVGLVFTLSPWWLVWDNTILTEAITLGAVALFAAGSGRWVQGESAVPMVVGAVIAILARPLTVPLIAVLLVIAFIARRKVFRPIWGALGLAALVGFAIVQSVAFNRRRLAEAAGWAVPDGDRSGDSGPF